MHLLLLFFYYKYATYTYTYTGVLIKSNSTRSLASNSSLDDMSVSGGMKKTNSTASLSRIGSQKSFAVPRQNSDYITRYYYY